MQQNTHEQRSFGTKNAYSLKTLNITVHRLRNEALLGQAITHCEQPGFIQHMVYYSENQEAKHATNALLANRAAFTQNMNILHLKTKVSRSTHGTQ